MRRSQNMVRNEFDNLDIFRVPTSKTILLVEDEALVRRVIKEVLEIEGFLVLEASDGDEAVSISKAHLDEIHLLLTDVVMPKLNGKTVAAELARERPEMRVMYISGFPRHMLESRG